MPYYCTVPRCTSMAGKAKNVSFHQFPRDEELAKLWNKILKRGKPYTKYSKVCSLHFTPEDYTITSVGKSKNKGQWRTLRRDAIPSQNLPSDSPLHHQRHQSTGAWVSSNVSPNLLDSQLQQQMAQAIYMQTMLAMQAAAVDPSSTVCNETQQNDDTAHTSNETQKPTIQETELKTSYKCTECSKCFKDPDVFILHQRTHTKSNEKENYNTNNESTLKSNPILANLLKSEANQTVDVSSNILSIENQIMATLAANMESYIKNLMSTQQASDSNDDSDCDRDMNQSTDSNSLVIDETV